MQEIFLAQRKFQTYIPAQLRDNPFCNEFNMIVNPKACPRSHWLAATPSSSLINRHYIMKSLELMFRLNYSSEILTMSI
nr:hypothetical transcript [Hymenolepis microstoma]